jgi:hypothetical protein
MRVRRLGATVATGAVLVISAMVGAAGSQAATPAPVKPATHTLVSALVGSPDYLVYMRYPGTKPSARPFMNFRVRRPIYALGRSGPPRRIATIGLASRLSLVGSMLVEVANEYDLRWWNLATGQHGAVTYPQASIYPFTLPDTAGRGGLDHHHLLRLVRTDEFGGGRQAGDTQRLLD